MKKFKVLMIIGMLSIMFMALPVKASNVTIADVVTKVKESEVYKYLNPDDKSTSF